MPLIRQPVDAWVSLFRASQMLGETRQKTLARIVAGELAGQVVAGRTVVDRAAVERLMSERAQTAA